MIGVQTAPIFPGVSSPSLVLFLQNQLQLHNIGTLRYTAVTSMIRSPQNITLLNRKFFTMIQSPLRRTMWLEYSKNKLSRAEVHTQVVVKTLNLMI